MCCDQAKWVETHKYWFWDIAKQKENFPFFSIVLQNLQLRVSVELTNQFSWGLLLKEPSPIFSTFFQTFGDLGITRKLIFFS